MQAAGNRLRQQAALEQRLVRGARASVRAQAAAVSASALTRPHQPQHPVTAVDEGWPRTGRNSG